LAEIWRARDRAGREVVFTSAGLAHVLHGHAEMAGRLDEVHAAIEQPDFVTRDVRYLHREIYYRRTPSGQGWIRVVVNYQLVPPQGMWAGEIITAYRVEKPKSKEVLLEP
jgi:hypothetical protein